mmetsp:Transcript_20741/g.43420  ORF Transcript_20741/g.43420 Transcript_20741/m.43420 type:complete len:118 (+) Transcript_20741:140-493(+)
MFGRTSSSVIGQKSFNNISNSIIIVTVVINNNNNNNSNKTTTTHSREANGTRKKTLEFRASSARATKGFLHTIGTVAASGTTTRGWPVRDGNTPDANDRMNEFFGTKLLLQVVVATG